MDIETARRCMEDPSGPECEEIAGEYGKQALVDAGVDPAVADAAVDCLRTRDREQCAKSSAKIAATYACAALTSGAGTVVCNELAPILIDKMWPVIGPPLTYAWDVGLNILELVGGSLAEFVKDLGELIGFGDDGPTYTEKLNSMLWAGNDIVAPALDAAVSASVQADLESRRELGLPVNVEGVLGQMPPVQPYLPPAARKGPQDMIFDFLRSEPGFGAVYVVARPSKKIQMLPDYEVVSADYVPKHDEMLLEAPAMPPGWRPGSTEWSPHGFKIVKKALFSPISFFDVLAGAYGVILSARTDAIRKAAVGSVGQIVADNSVEAKSDIIDGLELREDDSGSVLWWTLALVGAGAAAYYYRKPLKQLVTL